MNVRDMIKSKLVEMGADGLVNADLECGCEIGDLVPCGMDCTDCVAARKDKALAEKNDANFWMVPIDMQLE